MQDVCVYVCSVLRARLGAMCSVLGSVDGGVCTKKIYIFVDCFGTLYHFVQFVHAFLMYVSAIAKESKLAMGAIVSRNHENVVHPHRKGKVGSRS